MDQIDHVGCWDSVLLENESENCFISNLQQRYKRDFIYTFLGSHIIFLNPYCKPSTIFSSDIISSYAEKSLFQLPPHIYSLTNNVYKSLQDNNEDQCIVLLGESSSGKTENGRMVIRFLSKISGRYIPLQRQRSSNSIASYKSSPKSSCSTPKHKSSSSTIQSVLSQEKSSCFKTEGSGSGGGGKNKKISRVEFDFSYQKCNEIDTKHDMIKYCPKHNCCNVSSSSSTASNPIDIPVRRKSTGYQLQQHHQYHPNLPELPGISKSFTIYETMNRVQINNKKVPNCLDHSQPSQPLSGSETSSSRQTRCESLDLIKMSNQNSIHKSDVVVAATNFSKSFDESMQLSKNHTSSEKRNHYTQIRDPSYDRKKINLDNFKSAKRKVPIKNHRNVQLSNLEIQTMKERIAQAEIFLEAMGNASTLKNRDSSRYGKYFDLEIDYRGDLVGGHIMHYSSYEAFGTRKKFSYILSTFGWS